MSRVRGPSQSQSIKTSIHNGQMNPTPVGYPDFPGN
jgi:hypothetical protein